MRERVFKLVFVHLVVLGLASGQHEVLLEVRAAGGEVLHEAYAYSVSERSRWVRRHDVSVAGPDGFSALQRELRGADPAWFVVGAPGYAPKVVDYRVRDSWVDGIQLDREGRLVGRCHDREGGGVSGVLVTASELGVQLAEIPRASMLPGAAPRAAIYSVRTDDQGRFELVGVPAGDYVVQAWKSGHVLLAVDGSVRGEPIGVHHSQDAKSHELLMEPVGSVGIAASEQGVVAVGSSDSVATKRNLFAIPGMRLIAAERGDLEGVHTHTGPPGRSGVLARALIATRRKPVDITLKAGDCLELDTAILQLVLRQAGRVPVQPGQVEITVAGLTGLPKCRVQGVSLLWVGQGNETPMEIPFEINTTTSLPPGNYLLQPSPSLSDYVAPTKFIIREQQLTEVVLETRALLSGVQIDAELPFDGEAPPGGHLGIAAGGVRYTVYNWSTHPRYFLVPRGRVNVKIGWYGMIGESARDLSATEAVASIGVPVKLTLGAGK